MRDWAALVSVSNDGRLVLIRLGRLRLALVEVQQKMVFGQWVPTDGDLQYLRSYIQRLAVGLELLSTPGRPRPGLTNFMPGGMTPAEAATAINEMAPSTVGSLVRSLDKLGHWTH
jgi:hypothetical protein